MSNLLQESKARLSAAAAVDPRFPGDRFDGRGIVICAGGARLFTCAWVTIALLRQHLACTLPIEVWHLGPEEMGPPMRGLLEELDVYPVDAFEVAKRHQVDRLGGWELKSYAVMHSRFCEVLLLDADNVPVRDPSFLFDRAEYRDPGTLFWPDLWRLSRDNEIWSTSGLSYRDMPSIESGQMVLDKSRCWRALTLAHWMNQHSDSFYKFLYGDKDTFLISWLMVKQPYHLIRHRPKLLDETLCQRDPEGTVLFQHRSGAKWIFDGNNLRIDGFRLEGECRALLHGLRALWDGRIFNPPGRSKQARRLEVDLARRREFRFIRVSSDERRIELLPDHRIRPARRYEHYWHVADGTQGLELRIEGDGLRSCALRQSADGSWHGRYLQPPNMPVELISAGAANSGETSDDSSDRAALLSVVDRILDSGISLPWDREVACDLAATLRTLAILDPAVVEHLEDQGARSMPGSARAQAVHVALAGLVDPVRRSDAGRIMPGHDRSRAPFLAEHRYER